MNRLLILVASVSLAIVTISSTCLAEPPKLAAIAPHSASLASDRDGLASGWSASLAPLPMADEGRLSL